jgi:hypothetical protein
MRSFIFLILHPTIRSFTAEGTSCKNSMSHGVYGNTPLLFSCLEPGYEVLPGEGLYFYEAN